MTLAGSLDELPLLDVLQLLTVAGRTGSFRISGPTSSGEIRLSRGEIVDATSGSLKGEPALFDLTLWRSGSFSFEPTESRVEGRTIHREATAVMTDAAHQLDVWARLEKTVPHTDGVPSFSDTVPNANVVLTPADWAVVRNIDGTRTVAEIAGIARKSLFETCNSLDGLIRAELVLPLAGGGNAGECSSSSGVEAREEAATV